MRVALDEQIFAIQAYGGISRMFAELARQFVVGKANDVQILPLSAPVITRYLLDDPELRKALGVHEARNEWTALARYFTRLRIHPRSEIVHNTFYLPHGLAPTRGAKRIVTVHDMIPELMPYTRRRLDLLTLKRRYVDTADHVICVSEATKRDLLEVYGPIKAPISVVHHGVDARFTTGGAPLPGWPARYVLMVGNRSQYKDAEVLFRAFSRVALEHGDIHLVCLGGGTFTAEEVSQLESLGIVDRCHQHGLPDEQMPAAYSNAEVFVFPSRFEGFGLPALEAMACGTPTVLADATSLPEVGGDAALYFPAGDDSALAMQISRILVDPQLVAGLRLRGLARAGQFTWPEAANRTEAVYRSALA
ncbi:MAG: glycosyltransferase family 4 protein [Actinomycetes bacterium]